ncbi:hypothetical protein L0668_09405 [Paraglaciecola aquimarina]|uniref:Uncharacterized protein n=1 Tax=Paraglaciecola algarum TaxID=3050085 RepID=A0ABS9D617_9ALTE|nr:hypothetical protein [Paraglaciecola sp. G1-23]MCF2948321.1 hypothetical protein [Paraglaciecola sp. G1-23]
MTNPTNNQVSLTDNIKRALKANFIPGVFLQVFALMIALSYFFWPASQSVFTFFADLKDTNGALYAIVSTALFGGVIPFLYLYLNGKIAFSASKQFLFYVFIWALLGWIVNEFYLFQSYLFGDGNDWLTIIKKAAFDQFVFSAILTCPWLTLVYLWKDQRFSWARTRPLLGELVKVQIPTTVLTNWLIWIPAVCLIYTMPPNLQIPLFNLVLCFFVLIFAILQSEPEVATSTQKTKEIDK